ncbi:MAG: hypothetical protein Q8M58_16095, partial [Anaerolineales bacterium]|nr:hypothetical protein [Anaerolineales bacterium]
PKVNQRREGPRELPTASLELLVQVGGIPGLPGASAAGSGTKSAGKVQRGFMDWTALLPSGGSEEAVVMLSVRNFI